MGQTNCRMGYWLIMKILMYPNENLSKPCEPVTVFDEALHKELDEMGKLMLEAGGIGLSSNQVGLNKAMFVMKTGKGDVIDIINPKIMNLDGKYIMDEGCLSAPGVTAQVPRAQCVYLQAQNRHGQTGTFVAYDVEAVCVQHEVDHLFGVFYLDKTSRQQRRRALKKLNVQA